MKHTSVILLLAFFATWSPLLYAGTTSTATNETNDSTELTPAQKLEQWALAPSYSYSFFDGGREGWQEQDTQLYYQLNRQWSLGLEIDYRDRPPTGSDVAYGGFASYSPSDKLELHAKLMGSFDPTFTANEAYSAGFQYQVIPHLALLLDYRGWNFNGQLINQGQPGVLIGINDAASLTLEYAHGWAFSTFEYNYYIAIFNYEFPSKQRLTLAFDYGTDPDYEIGASGTTAFSLSPAYTGTIFFRQPLGKDLDLYTGFEYDYRLNQNGHKLYQEYTPTISVAWKF
jgi:YaiO family outer membrane protein